ncbi:uncharacterized protein LOC120258500 [Dioscorea cayenensis subsp. rotundata]|uniref:Uncharacterized protein LOC120258500 n=1 Tax=Dioscorea cayennensis subsp. rotundata TaxID=55577 RepID=A0AB40B3M4_DIOCR|nr:uncharacterized protein LOC120258500 [Dioscorea cayenensis subsp. rotundata]XP_039121865.1 uncharacterized protein LOC120258500 [Dioscorea cayenensis subsp. rotundata]XP_039121866.1 uncharacterized protein LOC120258500 [Dioscorea cayenensis subsp. rotundata]
MLEAKSLRKALIPPSLIPNPSPGNLQSTRLALLVNGDASSCSVFIASGCRVYKIEVSMDDSVVTKGKESLLIPVQAHVIRSSEVDRCPHRSEIQSVVLAEGDGDNCLVMGTVDSYGHLIVSQLDAVGSDIDRLSYSVLPKDSGAGEGSWSGVCFSPIHWSTAAVARSFCKSIDIYDQDIHIRSLHTLWYPAALSFLGSSITGDGSSSVVAVAEGSQLTIWDLRTNHNGGCVQRICGSVGDLIYAVCCSPSGAVAVGGSDRTVTIYDPRRWSAMSRWVNCSKYEITGLSFSSTDSTCVYIQGVDYEVLCGQWKENKKIFSFRGDSNWLGFSKCANMDVLAGWCESGSIFVADVWNPQSI